MIHSTFKYQEYIIGELDENGHFPYIIRLLEFEGTHWYTLLDSDKRELDTLFFLGDIYHL